MPQLYQANLVDIPNRRIVPARLRVEGERIAQIDYLDEPVENYLLPGFVDAHIHIESSMLTPAAFARIAVAHGTVATVSDPHEIANVLGVEGIDFMIEEGRRTPFHFHFGAPSCVPATPFETNGATLDAETVGKLLAREEIGYLSEVMNFPGVIARDKEVMAKIEAARRLGKPVDGHAPGLRGEALTRYIEAGITTDHESSTLPEAREKLQKGMKILIREGSAARNFDALHPLIAESPGSLMFCSDDRHPDDLVRGHINDLVRRAVALGYDLFDVLAIACLNPIDHYGLPLGRLRPGDRADFIEVSDLSTFSLRKTVIAGRLVADESGSLLPASPPSRRPNRFVARPVDVRHLQPSVRCSSVRVIVAKDHELLTGAEIHRLPTDPAGVPLPDPANDILKLIVLERYHPDATPAVAFIRGFGLQRGAIASSVAHDSHNIVAVGVDDASLAEAINAVIAGRGGIAATNGHESLSLPLPVAGLMSDGEGEEVAQKYEALQRFVAEELGGRLKAPFMTLSFMALPVIPALKLTDRGLFDVDRFAFTELCGEAEQ